jgi:hypothetical protein
MEDSINLDEITGKTISTTLNGKVYFISELSMKNLAFARKLMLKSGEETFEEEASQFICTAILKIDRKDFGDFSASQIMGLLAIAIKLTVSSAENIQKKILLENSEVEKKSENLERSGDLSQNVADSTGGVITAQSN